MKKKTIIATCMSVVLAALIGVGCKKESDSKTSVIPSDLTEQAVITQVTGEQIFDAIYFKQQNLVLANLPTLQQAKSFFVDEHVPSNAEVEALNSLRLDVHANILALDPTFFVDFKTEIASDDYKRIEAALDDASVMITTALASSSKYGAAYSVYQKAMQNLNMANYDLSKAADRAQFQQDLTNEVKNNNPQAIGVALAVAVVVAAVVWEVAAIVNVVAIGTVLAETFAVAHHIGALWIVIGGQDGEYYTAQVLYELAAL